MPDPRCRQVKAAARVPHYELLHLWCTRFFSEAASLCCACAAAEETPLQSSNKGRGGVLLRVRGDGARTTGRISQRWSLRGPLALDLKGLFGCYSNIYTCNLFTLVFYCAQENQAIIIRL